MEMRTTLTSMTLVTAIFFLLTAFGHWNQAFISLMALMGLSFPLAYAWKTNCWMEMGFTRRNSLPALGWGLAGGLVSALTGLLVVGRWTLTENWLMEMLIGLPVWMLLAVPFQEFFFRAYLQTRLDKLFGKAAGFVTAVVVFTLWHYILPIFGPGSGSTFPVNTWQGLAGTLVSACVYSYVFQRSGNILAPWLAHALPGIAFLLVGAASMIP
jgi:membrane protease YdiL (CAAX protease family)